MANTARKKGIGKPKGGSSLYQKRYIMWAASDWNDLTVSTKSDANVDSGFAMADGYLYEGAWDGGGAAAITLPQATSGMLCVFRFTEQADGGQNITFTTYSGDYYAAQTLDTVVHNAGDEFGSTPVKGHDFTSTIAINGGAIKSSDGDDNVLTIASTATNNQTHKGAELAFFCRDNGYWRVSFKGSELGSGAINATFAFS
jgi:hypothetical protein